MYSSSMVKVPTFLSVNFDQNLKYKMRLELQSCSLCSHSKANNLIGRVVGFMPLCFCYQQHIVVIMCKHPNHNNALRRCIIILQKVNSSKTPRIPQYHFRSTIKRAKQMFRLHTFQFSLAVLQCLDSSMACIGPHGLA